MEVYFLELAHFSQLVDYKDRSKRKLFDLVPRPVLKTLERRDREVCLVLLHTTQTPGVNAVDLLDFVHVLSRSLELQLQLTFGQFPQAIHFRPEIFLFDEIGGKERTLPSSDLLSLDWLDFVILREIAREEFLRGDVVFEELVVEEHHPLSRQIRKSVAKLEQHQLFVIVGLDGLTSVPSVAVSTSIELRSFIEKGIHLFFAFQALLFLDGHPSLQLREILFVEFALGLDALELFVLLVHEFLDFLDVFHQHILAVLFLPPIFAQRIHFIQLLVDYVQDFFPLLFLVILFLPPLTHSIHLLSPHLIFLFFLLFLFNWLNLRQYTLLREFYQRLV